MKILIHSLYFHPDKTGVAKYSGEMAQWFRARGHTVEVVTGFPHYPEWRLSAAYPRTRFLTEDWDGVTVHRVPHYVPTQGRVTALQRILLDVTFFLGSLWKWRTLFRGRNRFDAVIAVCPTMFSGIPPLFSAWLCKVPWVYHIQDFQVDAALRLKMLKLGLLGSLLYRLENYLVRSASRVASITPAMCRRAIAKGADESRLLFLPNWADVHGLKPAGRDNPFRASVPMGQADMLVLYAGAMGAKQGLEMIIDVARGLSSDPRFHFLIVSAGPEFERLQALARDAGLANIGFLPLQPRERLGDMLAAADVHLVIQKADAADLVMPSKLTNILAIGRPAVATADPGTALWDVLVGHDAGVAVPPESPQALQAALIRLAEDPEACRRMGGNARRYAEKHLDQEAILARFEQELIDMIKAPEDAKKPQNAH
jgi:colanic acid biosynthesis glycosyl transferase WcaI